LADTFADISSDKNFVPEFRSHKNITESSEISDFHTCSQDISCNQPITELEVRTTIVNYLKNSSPGLDSIIRAMLKHLYSNAIALLTALFPIFHLSSYLEKIDSNSYLQTQLKRQQN